MKKKGLILVLCCALLVAYMPIGVFGADSEAGVAQIGNTTYATLQDAFDSVPGNGQVDTTVTLISDIVMNTADIATLDGGKSVTLDMNGKTISGTADGFKGRPIVNAGTLTVTGEGRIDSTLAVANGYGAINNQGTLTIENGTFAGNVLGNGGAIRNMAGSAVIKGGDFTGTCAVYNAASAELTIDGGNFHTTSASCCDKVNWAYCINGAGKLTINDCTTQGVQGALGISGGTATINGGDFKTVSCKKHGADSAFYGLYIAGEFDKAAITVNGGSFTSASKSAGWFGNNNSGGDGGIRETVTITVNGGTFNSGNGSGYILMTDFALATVEIKGGTYNKKANLSMDTVEDQVVQINSDPDVKKTKLDTFIPTGYEVNRNGGQYTVRKIGAPVTEETTNPDGSTTTTTTQKDTTTGVESKAEVVTGTDGQTTAKVEVSVPTKVETTGSVAKAEVSQAAAEKLVEQAKAAEKVAADAGASKVASTVTIETKETAASKIQTILPASAIKSIANETKAAVKLVSPVGEVVVDNEALKEIAAKAGTGEVALTVETVEKTDLPEAVQATVGEKAMVLDLSVETDDGKVTDFGQGSVAVTVEIPEELGTDVKVMYVKDNGEAEKVAGEVITEDEKNHYRFTTDHFSYYALADRKVVDKAVEETENAKVRAGIEATTIAAKATGGKGSVSVSWTKSEGHDVEIYEVFRSTSKNGEYKMVSNTLEISLKDTSDMKAGETYYYKVRGARTVGKEVAYTKWSNVVSATPTIDEKDHPTEPDTPEQHGGPTDIGENNDTDDTEKPGTGDNSPLGMYILLGITASLLFGVELRLKKNS